MEGRILRGNHGEAEEGTINCLLPLLLLSMEHGAPSGISNVSTLSSHPSTGLFMQFIVKL